MSLMLQEKISGDSREESDIQHSTEDQFKRSSRCDYSCEFACVRACVTEWRLFGLNFASHRWHKKQRSPAKIGRERCRSAAGGDRGFGAGSRHLSERRKRGQRQCHSELTGSTQIFCRENSLPQKSSEIIGIISTLAAVKRKRKFCHLNYYTDSDRRDSNTWQ